MRGSNDAKCEEHIKRNGQLVYCGSIVDSDSAST